jgi:hypothetical protein
MLFNRRKLPTTQEAMDALCDSFLEKNGFAVNDEMRALFGSYVQHSDERDDTFSPSALAKCIRKALANQCAFYLIHPSRRAKPPEEPKDEQG